MHFKHCIYRVLESPYIAYGMFAMKIFAKTLDFSGKSLVRVRPRVFRRATGKILKLPIYLAIFIFHLPRKFPWRTLYKSEWSCNRVVSANRFRLQLLDKPGWSITWIRTKWISPSKMEENHVIKIMVIRTFRFDRSRLRHRPQVCPRSRFFNRPRLIQLTRLNVEK